MATVANPSDSVIAAEIAEAYPDLRVSVRRFHPVEAMSLLADRRNPRRIKPRQVHELAEALRRGEGHLTWDAIVIEPDGTLGPNGQHRLEAIVESGVSMDLVVLEGLPEPDVSASDRGAIRTIGEILGARGEAHYNRIAAVLTRLAVFEQTGEPAAKFPTRLSPHQAVKLLDVNPDVRDAVAQYPEVPAISPATTTLLWLLCWRIDPEDTKAFFLGVGEGVALGDGDVRLLLRNRLIDAERRTISPITPRVLSAFFIMAWNSYRQGQDRVIFRYKPGGANPDRFPLLDGHSYPEATLKRLGY
jgi:hypothetical protein